MPADTAEAVPNSVARFNQPGRTLPRMGGEGSRGDNEGTVKPSIAKRGYIRFLTLRDLDGRSRAAARCKELVRALEVDLGGADQLTCAQQQLVQRAALLGTTCEDFEVRFALGEPIELADYLSTCNVQRRILATLGLERRARDVSTPTLSEYLAAHPAAETAEPDAPAGDENAVDGTVEPAGEPKRTEPTADEGLPA